MKWTYLVSAPDQPTAATWLKLLLGEGIPATLQPEDAISPMPPRLLVPDGMVCEALAVLSQLRGK